MEKYIDKVQIFANKFGSISYIKAITDGVSAVIPAIIIGSIYTLLGNIQFQPYLDFLESAGIKDYLSIPNNTTMGIISILLTFTVAYSFARNFNQDGVSAGIISVCSFVLLIPFELLESGSKAIPTLWLGAQGMFMAMIVGAITGKLFVVMKEKNMEIKMPENVPPATVRAFSAIIPGFIIITLFLLVHIGLEKTSFETFPQLVSTVIQTPLSGIGSSVWAVALIWLLSNFVWFFGIHGIVVVSVVNPILISIDLENLERTQAGEAATQIIGKNFTNVYGGMTGAGIIMGLIILMTFFAKSKQYRTLGKLSIVPDIFSIAEPAIFGTPIVLNLVLIIPFMLVPTISTIVAYFMTQAGILPILSGIQLPWSMPVVLQGFLLGGWRVALYQAVLLVFSAAVYYPFFKVLDKRAYAVEQGELPAE
ncbi:PTS sugar transporter subunit IIC [Candidatus Enterococcus huntleyi]|uniref:PTS sugar transporter subunit IIC n=1 Tax=Candidatus Enterococcus huntleyi TaxID=1857217 RepID=UPI001379CDBE|nr:PTS transporter subunit EIIC [Enterococcus sp. JM4C]